MDRIFESGAAASPPSAPASPSSGYATAGNPQTAVPATKPGPYWYHQVTEELRAVIAGAGLTPSHTDLTQLYQAIQRIAVGGDYKASVRAATTANITLSGEQTIDGVAVVAGDRVLVKDQTAGAENGIYLASAGAWTRTTDADAAGELTSGAIVPVESGTLNADTMWMLTTDGAITIGTTALVWQIKSGDASTTRKGQVQLATSAEAQALTNALNALTPATLAGALQGTNQSLTGNGYQRLPGGLIVQWGNIASVGGGAIVTVTLPIAFPNAVLNGQATASGNSTTAASAWRDNLTTTQFTIRSDGAANSAIYWLAIGY